MHAYMHTHIHAHAHTHTHKYVYMHTGPPSTPKKLKVSNVFQRSDNSVRLTLTWNTDSSSSEIDNYITSTVPDTETEISSNQNKFIRLPNNNLMYTLRVTATNCAGDSVPAEIQFGPSSSSGDTDSGQTPLVETTTLTDLIDAAANVITTVTSHIPNGDTSVTIQDSLTSNIFTEDGTTTIGSVELSSTTERRDLPESTGHDTGVNTVVIAVPASLLVFTAVTLLVVAAVIVGIRKRANKKKSI